MNISEHEMKRRQHEKELISLKNRMGKNIVWFNSLSKTKQYDILFKWKHEKKVNKLTKPEFDKRLRQFSYPPSLKHFIKKFKRNIRFMSGRKELRNTVIDLILNSKK